MFRKSAAMLAAFLVLAVLSTSSATAHPNFAAAPPQHRLTMCEKAFSARLLVIVKHGRRAPGRNICRFGVKHSNDVVQAATLEQKGRYLRQLRALLAPPPPFATLTAGMPAQLPAGTLTAHIAMERPTGLIACIIHSESGGNPQASNGSHFGIGQWDIQTWLAHGGGRYAPTPLGATYAQQYEILATALARFGCSAWCPYDPC